MTIKFSMDRIKNMDQLYTWTPTYSEELGCPGEEEHYHGTAYCKQVIADGRACGVRPYEIPIK